MPSPTPTLHMLCGKIASGKSTLANTLAAHPDTVRLSEDDWLHALYGEEMHTLADYVRCAAKLRAAIGPHVADLLRAGLSVVLDFQANTVEARSWMRSIIDASGSAHALHVMTTSDATCLARLRARNESGDHPFAATEAQFHRTSARYVPPAPEEGFDIVLHEADEG
ncbi:ATP-binding protein [uncultured Jannaschia sp.]|uniref:AAA family ATPase n=1 Tax=uncultured Jannaschia sp. TaxID=293347 RepID=UPI0026103491|nr:ATP-binding protein [uncultured Jannaschia sp.]